LTQNTECVKKSHALTLQEYSFVFERENYKSIIRLILPHIVSNNLLHQNAEIDGDMHAKCRQELIRWYCSFNVWWFIHGKFDIFCRHNWWDLQSKVDTWRGGFYTQSTAFIFSKVFHRSLTVNYNNRISLLTSLNVAWKGDFCKWPVCLSLSVITHLSEILGCRRY
jgi:hypothetical protein